MNKLAYTAKHRSLDTTCDRNAQKLYLNSWYL